MHRLCGSWTLNICVACSQSLCMGFEHMSPLFRWRSRNAHRWTPLESTFAISRKASSTSSQVSCGCSINAALSAWPLRLCVCQGVSIVLHHCQCRVRRTAVAHTPAFAWLTSSTVAFGHIVSSMTFSVAILPPSTMNPYHGTVFIVTAVLIAIINDNG